MKEVTGYDLWNNYEDAFEPANKNGIESIFEVQFKEGNEGYASNFFYVFCHNLLLQKKFRLSLE